MKLGPNRLHQFHLGILSYIVVGTTCLCAALPMFGFDPVPMELFSVLQTMSAGIMAYYFTRDRGETDQPTGDSP